MTSSSGDWSARANYWRGDRALGGHVRVAEGVLTFEPHGLERALGGDTAFSTKLVDVVRLSRAPRSFRVPRRRLVVTTRSGDEAYFLVSKLDSVIRRLAVAIESDGGHVDVDLDPSAPLDVPEDHPDNSRLMNWVFSAWGHVVGLTFWSLALVGVLQGSRNRVVLIVLAALILFSGWRAWAGFRRRAAIRAQLAEPRPDHE
ncbi:hypothetical protein [Aeromicrobium sp. Root236]|uniref:hypothetical protein n=1 Tax=Aeromicrobium sp. Root236 TaxID=1736498 RepID=UPI0012FA8F9F|nr:hypothetical protein [Aeromicrobium sp. Root236]